MQSEANEVRRKNKQKVELIAYWAFVIMSVVLLLLFSSLFQAHFSHDINRVYLIFAVMIMLVVLYIIGLVTLCIKYGFIDRPSFFYMNGEYIDLHSSLKKNWKPIGGGKGGINTD